MPPKAHVLDSYALLALLEDQPGADRVSEIISVFQVPRYMSVVNLAEVLYVIERRRSRQAALDLLQAMTAAEEIALVEATLDQAARAAGIKVKGGLSLADCFALALAKEVGGVIVTGDPEFRKAEKEVPFEWI